MNCRWLLLALVLLAAPLASAQSQPFWSTRVEWYSANYDEVLTTLEQDSSFTVLPVVNTVCEIWSRRDGAMGSEVAPAVARALIHHSTLTLRWFRDHPSDFQAWLDRMPYDLLTDYSDEQSEEMEVLRLQLANTLSEYATEERDASLASMAQAVVDVATNSVVRQVD